LKCCSDAHLNQVQIVRFGPGSKELIHKVEEVNNELKNYAYRRSAPGDEI